MEETTWCIWYVNCEGNERWYTKECPADWEEWQVREAIPIGGCGDDVAEILSVNKMDGGCALEYR